MRNCASCRFWEATEIYVVNPSAAPHEQAELARGEAYMRATHALCSWPYQNNEWLSRAPQWVKNMVGGGTLTGETDGEDCVGWQPRPDIKLP